MPSRVTLRRKSRAAAPAAEAVAEEKQQEQAESVAPGAAAADEAGHREGQEGKVEGEGEGVAGEGKGEAGAEAEASQAEASTSAVAAKPSFALVMDNGQLALVPAAKAHAYRSLPKRGQKVDDESGMSTPTLKAKKKSKGSLRGSEAPSPHLRVRPLKRGRGRPPKNPRAKSRMLEFEFEEDDEGEEEEGEGEEDEEEMEEEGADAPGEDSEMAGADETGGVDDDDLVPTAIEQSVYLQGKDYLLKNDELVLDVDEEGEKKVDEKGNLRGEREYSFKTFSSPYRADKEVVYALSIDAARGVGHRDSLYFLRRNPLLIKLSCTDREKVMLIEQGRLSGQLRTRNVTMLAVRNIFKTHGAKAIKDGRFMVDDYCETEARETGKQEGQPVQQAAVEEEVAAPPPRAVERRREADRDRDRARRRPDAFTFSTSDLQGNAIYTTFGDAGLSPFERAKGWNARRVNLQRADIDEENWMMEMARSVRGMNREIMLSRKERLKAFARPFEGLEGPGRDGDQALVVGKEEGKSREEERDHGAGLPIGFYEPVTNMAHYSSGTQPGWSTLERKHERPLLLEGEQHEEAGSASKSAVLGNAKVGTQGWGIASFDQHVRLPAPSVQKVVVEAGASAREESLM